MAINSCRAIIRPNPKTLSTIACVLLTGANAIAQVRSGTVVLIGYSKNKIVIAADSRQAEEGGPYHDDACKITALNNKFVFTATGRIFDVAADGRIWWNAPTQAREAFASASKQSRLPGHTLARDATDLWSQAMRENIASHIRPQEFATLRPNSNYVDGFFAGLGTTGDVQTGYAVIGPVVDPAAGRRAMGSTTTNEMSLNNTISYLVLGEGTTIFHEFFDAATPRARAETVITRKQSKKWSRSEADARMVIRMTELIIQYADYPDYVHGPVDAAEIDKGGTVHWIQRKPNCTD
jgi:hypothetical protein